MTNITRDECFRHLGRLDATAELLHEASDENDALAQMKLAANIEEIKKRIKESQKIIEAFLNGEVPSQV